MVAAFCVVANAFLLAAVPAAAVVDNVKMLAEIGVDTIEARRDDRSAAPSLIRRDAGGNQSHHTHSHHTQHGQHNHSQPASHAAKPTYPEAVLASHPVAYWQLEEHIGNIAAAEGAACGQDGGAVFGDPCLVDGAITGNPTLGVQSLIKSNANNLAIEFDGNNHILIPDSSFINTNDTGYTERTVELWFSAGDLGATNRSIFEEGNAQHSGLSMYARSFGPQVGELSMFLWDRGNAEVDFGDALINPDPIRCQFELHKPVYAALVFSSANMTVTGYIKRPDEGVTLCGQMKDLPTGSILRHHGHSGGNAVIGGIQGTARMTGLTMMNESTGNHNFVGTVDEVAIYNRALHKHELEIHVNAAED